ELPQKNNPFITNLLSGLGQELCIKTDWTPKKDSHGEIIGFIGAMIDITSFRRKEQGLLRQRDNHKNLLDTLIDPIWVFREQSIEFCNQKSLELIDAWMAEGGSDSFAELVIPEDEPRLLALLEGKGKDVPAVTLSLKENNSGIRWGKFSRQDILWDNHPAILICLQDRTEQKKLRDSIGDLQKKVKEIKQAKNEFFDNISYELRTPLNGITGLSQALKDGVAGKLPPKVISSLSIIHSSSKQVSKLINEIIDFSKLNDQTLTLDLQPISLKTTLEPVHVLGLNLIQNKALKLDFHISEDLPLVQADTNRLQQILLNLLNNAVKFSSEGKITVSATLEEKEVRISVADTGVGIPEQRLETIFDAFYSQPSASLQQGYVGPGIGLAVSRQLVELHEGKIRVRSLENVGSIFSFTLPVAENQSPALETVNSLLLLDFPNEDLSLLTVDPSNEYGQEATELEELSRQLPLILVVDDERINLMMLENLLTLNGYRVITSQDPLQALEIIEEEEPDLMLLDLMMPVMNGYEVCKKVRETYEPSALPILMLTAKYHTEDLIQGLNSGANDYLSKPFNKEELLARINIHLEVKENKQLKREIQRRQKAEQELSLSQYRLARILDTFEETIVAFDQHQKITFFNQQAEVVLGYKTQDLLGKSLSTILVGDQSENFTQSLSQFLNFAVEKENFESEVRMRPREAGAFHVGVTVSKLQLEKDPFYVMSFKSALSGLVEQSASDVAHQKTPSPLIVESEASNNKVQVLSEVFDNIIKYLSTGGIDLINDLRSHKPAQHRKQIKLMNEEEVNQEFRQTLVDMMNISLQYWKVATNKGKTELAEESGIWNVQLEGGETFRTRTLDKYLFLDALPKKPRWKDVVETAQYVLLHCPENASIEKKKLEEKLSDLLIFRQKMKLMNSGIPVLKKGAARRR
ncbi:MAG: hypothetical protein COB67_12365, partial [SAR324 cluster bacterium]